MIITIRCVLLHYFFRQTLFQPVQTKLIPLDGLNHEVVRSLTSIGIGRLKLGEKIDDDSSKSLLMMLN